MLDATEGRRRLRALAEKIGGRVDAVLCTAPENIYFFTGFRTMLYTRFTAVLIRMDQPEDPLLIAASVDQRLVEDRVWSPPWTTRVIFHGPDSAPNIVPTPAAAMAPLLAGARRLGVDSIRLSELDEVKAAAPAVDVVPVLSSIETVKEIKGEQEIAYLRQANRMAIQGIETARGLLEQGPVTELEIAVRLDAEARLGGADGFGYPTLVSYGAKINAPHSPALPRRVEPNQPLRIAFGPTVEGYSADVVRTLCLGKPPAELVRLQDSFLEAQEGVMRIIKPGVSVPEMMEVVRSVYARYDLLGLWRNSIGHGLGLTIHETPRINGASTAVLAEGMVVAIEPFVSVPGLGGYAHCDVLLVTRTGSELLTPGLRHIIQVGS
jgi:Xaa-Pro aminopeptidase